MAKLIIIAPDPCSNRAMEELCQYFRRLSSPYITLDILYFKSKKVSKSDAHATESALAVEAKSIKKLLKNDDRVFLMSEHGKCYATNELSKQFESWLNCTGRLCFVFGSAHGFHAPLMSEFPAHLSLSPMTTQHELALVIWLEQLYRLMTIRSGKRYHY